MATRKQPTVNTDKPATKAVKPVAQAKPAKPTSKPTKAAASSKAKPINKADKPKATQAWAVPRVFRDGEGAVYCQVGEQIGVPAYLTTKAGYVGVVYHGKTTPELRPVDYDKPFREAIKPYIETTLDVSKLAKQVLDAIVANDDPLRNDFISSIVKYNAANAPKADTKPRTRKAGTAGKAGTTKAARPDGYVCLADLLDEYKLDGKKVRAKLRATYTKPDHGWCWSADEAKAVRAKLVEWFNIK